MIILDSLKIVVLDFDDTLCIHTNHAITPDDTYNFDVIAGNAVFQDGEINEQIHKFMQLIHRKHITIGLMSATKSFKHMQAKHKWVKDNYGMDIENWCVGTKDSKVEMLKTIADVYEIDRHKLLLVDDLYITNTEAANAGFQAATPMEVVNLINELEALGQL